MKESLGVRLNDVLHQERDALGVVDHSDTRSCRPETSSDSLASRVTYRIRT